jgi:Mg2+ and Co2+ transporter CorA
MRDSRRSGEVVLTVFILLISLTLNSCQMLKRLGGSSNLDEANRLNQSASTDIDEIEKLAQQNKGKESQITAALNANNFDAAKHLMDETTNAIDQGLQRAQSAADKLDKASKLDLDQTIKDYLSYRAQSVQKAIEAFKELRQGIVTYRDSLGSTDKAVTDKAQKDLQQSSSNFEDLFNESKRLESKADDIARSNPDKIKPGQ